jgi:hypothetical protein
MAALPWIATILRAHCGRAGTRAHAVIAALVLSFAVAGCGRSEWQQLPVNDGGFSVLMRSEPHYVRQQVDTPAGKMFAHLYSSDRRDSYFAVGYSDYPIALVAGTPPEQLFAGVRDTWLKRIDGKLVMRNNSLLLDGRHPGAEFAAEGTVKGVPAFLQARLYLVDQRLYQLIAMGPKDGVSQGMINRFLNSFRLIQQSEVGEIRVEPTPK